MSMMVGRARASSMGDPGLFDWGRKALGYAAKTALGMTGFGGAAGAISAAVGPRTPRSVNGYVPQRPPVRPAIPQVMVPKPGVVGRVQRFIPGGFSGTTAAPVSSVWGSNGANGANGLACESGFRPNKTSYFLKDGSFVEAGSRCVRRRQRNPMNPRALSRAIGRIDAGKRFQNRMSQISTGRFTAAGKKKSCP